MSRIILLASFFLTLVHSCNFASSNKFSISNDYSNLYSHFRCGDSLIYISNSNNIDSFIVFNIDSNIYRSGLLGVNRKNVTVSMINLKSELYVEDLIVVEKFPNNPDSTKYTVIFNFFGFSAAYNKMTHLTEDNLFSSIGVSEYWIIWTKVPVNQQQNNSIIKIYWANEYGLVGYLKKNGDFYKLIQ